MSRFHKLFERVSPFKLPAGPPSYSIGLLVAVCAFFAGMGGMPKTSSAQSGPPAILVISEAAVGGPFYPAIFASFQTAVQNRSAKRVSIFVEHLGFTQFKGAEYEESLKLLLRSKYGDKRVGLIVALGQSALEYVLRERQELWPDLPVVFSFVSGTAISSLNLPPDVTGNTATVTLRDMVSIAQAERQASWRASWRASLRTRPY